MKISIKAARVNAKISAEYVAEKLDITVDTLYNWEKGKTIPNINFVKRLADIYGCDVSDFKEVASK